jgi:quinol monooxygenase YgiN
MAKIEAGTHLTTFVNVFWCQPDAQDALVKTLQRETDGFACRLPGFVTASIHRSLDGCSVVNYAQWTDARAFQHAMQGEHGVRLIREVDRLADRVDIHTYEVVSTHEPRPAPASVGG